ncbi:MAG: DotU family type IV/VI secretion system protein [bacterium]
MKNEQWLLICSVFEKMERFFEDREISSDTSDSALTTFSALTSVSTTERLQTMEPPPVRRKKVVLGEENSEDIIRLRAHIRTQLDYLRAKLSETLAERDCYLILFAMVAHFDEYVQSNYLNDTSQLWPPLQKELYRIDDAGELFYDTLDEILQRPQTLPLVYEVFYFCLNHGFQGRYNDNPVRITEYMRRLRAKIPLHEMENNQAAPEETGQIKYVGSMAWYYGAAAAGIAACYFLLQFAASHWGLEPIFRGW